MKGRKTVWKSILLTVMLLVWTCMAVPVLAEEASGDNSLSSLGITTEGVTVRLGEASYMQAKIGAVRTDMAYLRQLGKTSGILDVTIPEDAKYMPEN